MAMPKLGVSASWNYSTDTMSYARKWFLHLGVLVCKEWCPDCCDIGFFEPVEAYPGATEVV